MLGKLLGEVETAARSRIDGIVDGDLAIFMVQPGIDVFPALLEDLLAQHDGSWRRIRVEVVLWNIAPLDTGPAVVAEVENARFHTKPAADESHRTRKSKGSAYQER